jgi:hypothetical protein
MVALSKEKLHIKLKNTYNRVELVNFYVCKKNNGTFDLVSRRCNEYDSEIQEILNNKKFTKDVLASELVKLLNLNQKPTSSEKTPKVPKVPKVPKIQTIKKIDNAIMIEQIDNEIKRLVELRNMLIAKN